MKSPKNPYHGWINFYKDAHITSAQACNHIKKLLQPQKIGFAGTLDPFAKGLLPIALGEATKLIPYFMKTTKTYIFDIKFGETTDTLDNTGHIIQKCSYYPTLEIINQALPQFIGHIQQTPPLFSAVKIQGERAYKKARHNEEFTIQPRDVIIEYFVCEKQLDPQHFRFKVTCHSGTYIRSLARDLAIKCHSLGHVTMLERIENGFFFIK